MTSDLDEARAALDHFAGIDAARLERFGSGLINETYRVQSARGAQVLQRVSPIFDPAIHRNIEAVTRALLAAGLRTPELLAWHDLGDLGVWRLLTFVDAESFDVVQDSAQAAAGAELVGRFHAALDGLEHSWAGRRLGVHDTRAHLAKLARALEQHTAHRLYTDVAELGTAILEAAAALPALPALAERVCHGDLKISNILFRDGEAVCLVDLDTLGPMTLAHELGDMWRSWCNPDKEDATQGTFDIPIFAASLGGYTRGLGRDLSLTERRALLHGVEWISLELASRFAADTLDESYFGWDRTRFPSAGAHHLVRARGQFALHGATIATRGERAALLSLAD